MRTLKNWWFAILGFALIILDQGFEILNPFLSEVGLSEKGIGIVKIVFGLYGVYKLKTALPTQNPEKLESLIEKTKESE